MTDFDTRRIGEIALLEEKLENALKTGAGYKMIAERWQPRAASELIDGKAKISLTFGGKTMAATFPAEGLVSADLGSATTEVLEALVKSFVLDQLRPVIQAEVRTLIAGAQTQQKPGAW